MSHKHTDTTLCRPRRIPCRHGPSLEGKAPDSTNEANEKEKEDERGIKKCGIFIQAPGGNKFERYGQKFSEIPQAHFALGSENGFAREQHQPRSFEGYGRPATAFQRLRLPGLHPRPTNFYAGKEHNTYGGGGVHDSTSCIFTGSALLQGVALLWLPKSFAL